MNQRAIIIGAGPAGLTAAYELLTRTDIQPIVLEKSDYMGGISRTVNYKGNRIDIGGHRFFSKSDRVMEWWLQMLPLEASENESAGHQVPQHGTRRSSALPPAGPGVGGPRDAAAPPQVPHLLPAPLLRLPDPLTTDTLRKLGLLRTLQHRLQLREERAVPI